MEALGAHTGLKSNEGSDENEKGFFEHPSIILLNEEVLQALGGSWDNPSFRYHDSNAATPALKPLREKAVALMQELFPEPSFIVLKEPRFCHLLPFWLEVFAHCGWQNDEIYCIHTLRHPVEVALSQQKRVFNRPDFYEFGREPEEGAALWLSLTTQALRDSAHLHNLFISYTDLVQHPAPTLQRMADFLRITPDAGAVARFADNFIEPRLHHHNVNEEALAHINNTLPEALALFEKLNAASCLSASEQQSLAETFSAPALLQRIDRITIRTASRLSYLARSRGFFLEEYKTELEQLKTSTTKKFLRKILPSAKRANQSNN